MFIAITFDYLRTVIYVSFDSQQFGIRCFKNYFDMVVLSSAKYVIIQNYITAARSKPFQNASVP